MSVALRVLGNGSTWTFVELQHLLIFMVPVDILSLPSSSQLQVSLRLWALLAYFHSLQKLLQITYWDWEIESSLFSSPSKWCSTISVVLW